MFTSFIFTMCKDDKQRAPDPPRDHSVVEVQPCHVQRQISEYHLHGFLSWPEIPVRSTITSLRIKHKKEKRLDVGYYGREYPRNYSEREISVL